MDRRRDAVASVGLAPRFVAGLRQDGELLPRGSRVLVALSGGLDSVVLLHLLLGSAAELGIEVSAAHFDHRMRRGSRADARWTRALCDRLDVPFVPGATAERLRTEAAARVARYRFLRHAAGRAGADRIATAHHADDQIETVLFRLARGTGLRGLRGIPALRGPFVRPLLPFRRGELAAYAARAGIEFREDPSNSDLRYTRNRLRHDVLPRLIARTPGVASGLLDLSAAAQHAETAWTAALTAFVRSVVLEESAASVELARERLLSYHPHITARLFRAVCRRVGCVPGRAGTRAALAFISSGSSGRSISLADGWRLVREFDRLRLFRATPDAVSLGDRPLRIEGAVGEGVAHVGGRRLLVRWGVPHIGGEREHVAFASSAVRLPLELRGWRPGERITLACGSKKLKKLLAERRIGLGARRRIAVLVDADGDVLWVAGVARSAAPEPVPGEPAFRIAITDAELH